MIIYHCLDQVLSQDETTKIFKVYTKGNEDDADIFGAEYSEAAFLAFSKRVELETLNLLKPVRNKIKIITSFTGVSIFMNSLDHGKVVDRLPLSVDIAAVFQGLDFTVFSFDYKKGGL